MRGESTECIYQRIMCRKPVVSKAAAEQNTEHYYFLIGNTSAKYYSKSCRI